MEAHLTRTPDDHNGGDTEPPEGENPEEYGNEKSHYLQDIDCLGVGSEVAIVVRKGLCETNESKTCEGRRSSSDEHARSVVRIGQTIAHQSVDVSGVHEDRDHPAESLE